jgi:hypothetical protein
VRTLGNFFCVPTLAQSEISYDQHGEWLKVSLHVDCNLNEEKKEIQERHEDFERGVIFSKILHFQRSISKIFFCVAIFMVNFNDFSQKGDRSHTPTPWRCP